MERRDSVLECARLVAAETAVEVLVAAGAFRASMVATESRWPNSCGAFAGETEMETATALRENLRTMRRL